MGILGTGWLLVWQIGALVAAGLFVALPTFAQAQDSVKPDRGPASLGTAGVVMMVWAYFTFASFVSGAWAARRAGAEAWLSLLIGAAAGAASGALAGSILYFMAEKGGPGWAWGGSAAIAVLLLATIGAPGWAR